MRRFLLILGFLLCAGVSHAQTPVISPVNPVGTPGGATIQFTVTANPGTGPSWSCTTCLGSINSSTGVYTPPATLAAPQSLGGYPLLPADHVYNTNISGLPVCNGTTHCTQSSATFIAGAGTVAFNYLPAFPINYVNGSTPTDTLTFQYTTGNNGTFQSPQWPAANVQNGWFGALAGEPNVDHHILTIDTTNGNLGERYQYYAQAPVSSCVANGSSITATINPTNTSPGFVRAAAVNAGVLIAGFISADTWCNGTPALSSATATTITFPSAHAPASTVTNGNVSLNTGCATCNSQSGIKYAYSTYALPSIATNAAGTEISPLVLRGQEIDTACANSGSINHALQMTLQNGYMHAAFIWPATQSANAGAGVNFYGERIRLQAAYNITGFSSCAQVLLTQLKNYGVLLVDGGTGWQVGTEWGDVSPTASNAMREINGALIAPSNFEVIDESSLEEAASSGATATGEVVCYSASTGTTCTNVALMGTAVNVKNSQYYIAAGAAQVQLVGYSNGAVTWTSPQSAGTIQPQNLVATTTTASSTTIATTQAVTSITGDFVDVILESGVSTTNPTSVTDVCMNTYTHDVAADFTIPAGGAVSHWYSIGITGCANNLWTGHWAAGTTYQSINVREYNPNGATITVDVVPTPVTSNTVGQTSITSNSFTTTGTNEVAIAAIGNLLGYQTTPGNIAGQPATNPLQASLGGFYGIATEDAIFTATETGITAAASYPAQNGGGISVMTFKGSGGTSIRGTLTSGGLYTPPANLTSPVTATMVVTSTVNSAVLEQMLVHIFPLTDMYLTQGTANYIDSLGNLWTGQYGIGASNAPSYQGCCQNNSSFPAITDKQLFWNHYGSSQTTGDYKIDLHVPVRTYNITYNLGTNTTAVADAMYFYTQGISQGSFNPQALVGMNEPYTYTQTTINAPSGVLSFYAAGIGAQLNNTGDFSSFAAVPSGPTVYVAQSAGTFTGGTACNGQTAETPVTFNAATPSPGEVIYFCGTITCTTNTNCIVVNASGTSGNPITFIWDTNAIIEEPACPQHGTGGCFQIKGNSYITLNGGTNGILENTANGTGLANQQGSTAIENDGGTNFIVENLAISNIYVHNSTSDSVIGDDSANCIYDNGTANGWVIQNNVMHDMSWCVEIQYNTTTNVTISGNTIYNIDHGIAFGGPNTGYTLSNVNIFNNNIHDYSNWDTAGDSYHHDGIHIWGDGDNGSDTISGINIYDNNFGGCIGTNVTAHVFMEANAGGTTNVKIFNNTFIDTCAGADHDGMLTTGVDGGYKIYNNTFIGTANDACMGTSSSPQTTFINNVVSGCGILMYIATGGGFAAASLHNNIYANCPGSNCFAYIGNFSGSFATWQSETGQDASPSAYAASSGLTSSGVPQAGSAVIGVGVNLTSLGIGALDNDIIGVARTVPWDAGAYKYGVPPLPPAPPTNLKIQVF